MSLNGLDAPAVQDAYQTAVADAGGWFILKYASRDSVELFGAGKGGVHEARHALAQHAEASPLYGLIMYRRRKVLIKYLPEGISRLLQARTTVHFQDILERYAPYETLLEIATADALNDTSLAAAFPLHTATPSTSSKRLHEISEDGEDHGGPPLRGSADTSASSSVVAAYGSHRHRMERRVDQLMGQERERARRSTPSIHVTNDNASSVSSPVSSPPRTSVSPAAARDEPKQQQQQQEEPAASAGSPPSFAPETDDIPPPVPEKDAAPAAPTAGDDPDKTSPAASEQPPRESFLNNPPASVTRTSTDAERPRPDDAAERPLERVSTADSARKYDDDLGIDWSKFEPKPKVKLGPRVVADGERLKRPTVAGVSTIPASYRHAPKKHESSRPKSQASAHAPTPVPPPATLPVPPPIPSSTEYHPRPVSRSSIKSLPSHKSNMMSPEKLRLMKAVELRKKQLRKSNPQPSTTFVPPKDEEVPCLPQAPEALAPSLAPNDAEPEPKPEPQAVMRHLVSSEKADSGIEMAYQAAERRDEGPLAESQPAPADPEAPTHVDSHLSEEAKLPEPEPEPAADPVPDPDPSAPIDPPQDVAASSTLSQPAELESDGLDAAGSAQESSLVPTIVVANGSQRASTEEHSDAPQALANEDGERPNSIGSEVVNGEASELSPEDAHQMGDNVLRRRHGFVEPLHVDTETDLTSDDDFLEELQSATLQEAKPMMTISVAKSPIADAVERRPSQQSVVSDKSANSVRPIHIRRTSFNMLDEFGGESPDAVSGGTPDSPPLNAQLSPPLPPDRGDPTHGLKRNVSSGISRRIHALAEASTKEVSPSATPRPSTPEVSPHAAWRERKSAVRSPQRTRTGSYQRHSGWLSGTSGRSTPTLSGSQHTDSVYNAPHDRGSNLESVSVTARIVRPQPGTQGEGLSDGNHPLQPSQLVINHRRASRTSQKSPPPINTGPSSPPPNSESASSMNSPSAAPHGSIDYRTIHSASQKSFGRGKPHHSQSFLPPSPHAEDFPTPPMTTTTSNPSVSANDENTTPKEGSRTSRFFKRMSNLGTTKRRSVQQPAQISGLSSTVDESTAMQSSSSVATAEKSDMPPAVVVGDLNIQFPDSLLWKRRIVEIDGNGNLIFSIPNSLTRAKRYRLDEFRMPSAPDLDRQELPHSVMLDFVDGMTLQAACEDGMTQRHVLQLLRTYWKAWAEAA